MSTGGGVAAGGTVLPPSVPRTPATCPVHLCAGQSGPPAARAGLLCEYWASPHALGHRTATAVQLHSAELTVPLLTPHARSRGASALVLPAPVAQLAPLVDQGLLHLEGIVPHGTQNKYKVQHGGAWLKLLGCCSGGAVVPGLVVRVSCSLPPAITSAFPPPCIDLCRCRCSCGRLGGRRIALGLSNACSAPATYYHTPRSPLRVAAAAGGDAAAPVLLVPRPQNSRRSSWRTALTDFLMVSSRGGAAWGRKFRRQARRLVVCFSKGNMMD